MSRTVRRKPVPVRNREVLSLDVMRSKIDTNADAPPDHPEIPLTIHHCGSARDLQYPKKFQQDRRQQELHLQHVVQFDSARGAGAPPPYSRSDGWSHGGDARYSKATNPVPEPWICQTNASDLNGQDIATENPPLDPGEPATLVASPTVLSTTSTDSPLSPTLPSNSTVRPALKSLYSEARHHLGGLLTHPYESTNQLTILRHGTGLVYFKGPSTSIAISVLSSAPLPPSRRLFLQRKGWSGQRGMKIRSALRINDAWLDVTPARSTSIPSTPPPKSPIKDSDERAWQRDVSHHLRKRPAQLSSHVLRETNIIRVPAASLDGYFRIVMTASSTDKKVLCASPVFRVASTSASASSFRGASLRTLPLELGLSVSTMLTTDQVSNFVAPVGQAAQSTYSTLMPGWARTAGSVANSVADPAGRVQSLGKPDEEYQKYLDQRLRPDEGEVDRAFTADAGGGEEPLGPQEPYPLHIMSQVVGGSGRGTEMLGMPTANLATLPPNLRLKLSGVYFGWARFEIPPPSGNILKRAQSSKHAAWPEPQLAEIPGITCGSTDSFKPALIIVSPLPSAASPSSPLSIAPERVARVYLISEDVPLTSSFAGYNVSAHLMGHLHGLQPGQDLPAQDEAIDDVEFAVQALRSPGWGVHELLANFKDRRREAKSTSGRIAAARQAGEDAVDRVRLDALGIRTERGTARDAEFEGGGLCILR